MAKDRDTRRCCRLLNNTVDQSVGVQTAKVLGARVSVTHCSSRPAPAPLHAGPRTRSQIAGLSPVGNWRCALAIMMSSP